jgi:hypothetical protein
MADKRRLTVHWRSIGSIEYLVFGKRPALMVRSHVELSNL